MKLVSVNVGNAQPIENAKPSGVTGIYKHAVHDRVHITTNGLVGDTICDAENHGGVDQAVYVYGTPDYDWWIENGVPACVPGMFGENLTLSDFESAHASIGDRLHIGSVTLEITAPRVPCVTLARRMDDPAFLKRFRAAERPGVYCRVIREGTVQAGDQVTLEPYAGARVNVIELFRNAFDSSRDPAFIRRLLAAPIAIRARCDLEQHLQALRQRE